MVVRREMGGNNAVVSVPVSDQERAKSFYVDTLGLELVRDDSSVPRMRWVQIVQPGDRLRTRVLRRRLGCGPVAAENPRERQYPGRRPGA